MECMGNKLRQNGQTDVDGRLLLACFLVRSGADTRVRNKDGKTPLEIACSMQAPAIELLGASAYQRSNADSEKCKFCFEETATTFSPCGHCFYCIHCGKRTKHCPVCGEFIVAKNSAQPRSAKEARLFQAMEPRIGDEIYRMVEKPRGICLIINNLTAEGGLMMSSLFTELHFKVTEIRDLTAGDMLLELVRASYAEELPFSDCLAVILMSHGTENTICGTDGKPLYPHRHVYPLFNDANCPDLQGKPKLFFVQTCDARRPNYTHEDESKSPASDEGLEYSTSSWSDMYCAHGTIRGFKPFEDIETTPWFFHLVDSVFRTNAGRTHLDALMVSVNNLIEHRSSAQTHNQTLKIQTHRWNKALYFNRGV